MENEKEWESRKTPTKLQFCSDLWGKHWLFWQLRGLPAVSFAVSDLQIRKEICGSDLTQSFQPWRLPLPRHQCHLWYLLQVTNLVRAWSQQEIDKHKKNMGKAVPTWNYLTDFDEAWTWEFDCLRTSSWRWIPERIEACPLETDTGIDSTTDCQHNMLNVSKAKKARCIKKVLFYEKHLHSLNAALKKERKSAKHFGLSTSLGRRFGWNANTVRSRVFCSMRGHACLRISGDHSSMDSEKMGAQNDSLNLFRLTFATSSYKMVVASRYQHQHKIMVFWIRSLHVICLLFCVEKI